MSTVTGTAVWNSDVVSSLFSSSSKSDGPRKNLAFLVSSAAWLRHFIHIRNMLRLLRIPAPGLLGSQIRWAPRWGCSVQLSAPRTRGYRQQESFLTSYLSPSLKKESWRTLISGARGKDDTLEAAEHPYTFTVDVSVAEGCAYYSETEVTPKVCRTMLNRIGSLSMEPHGDDSAADIHRCIYSCRFKRCYTTFTRIQCN